MRKCWILLFLLPLFFACTPDSAEVSSDKAAFFDLRSYVNEEVDRLTSRKTKVTKTITLNGKTETKELDDLNFANDLRVFREADINKPAWLEKYETKRKALSGSHQITTYEALDSNLVTRQLLVEEDLGEVTRITIQRKTGTVLSNGNHWLEYVPATGYSMTTRQKNRFGEDVDARIVVDWRF
ncbi:hypothetical protein [Neolewinella agarilytica]|uniref:Lipoprotein n=1 Tax=Neolewinella agarilytica TaxID=478744 RepID=A0A1H9IC97_9BACT|nr:hypothetical protein [Neolewinella agarilytica]SEQ72174.1 hypothetical protein SAMN05444359_114137 [Neolewinella agarilytica]